MEININYIFILFIFSYIYIIYILYLFLSMITVYNKYMSSTIQSSKILKSKFI